MREFTVVLRFILRILCSYAPAYAFLAFVFNLLSAFLESSSVILFSFYLTSLAVRDASAPSFLPQFILRNLELSLIILLLFAFFTQTFLSFVRARLSALSASGLITDALTSYFRTDFSIISSRSSSDIQNLSSSYATTISATTIDLVNLFGSSFSIITLACASFIVSGTTTLVSFLLLLSTYILFSFFVRLHVARLSSISNNALREISHSVIDLSSDIRTIILKSQQAHIVNKLSALTYSERYNTGIIALYSNLAKPVIELVFISSIIIFISNHSSSAAASLLPVIYAIYKISPLLNQAYGAWIGFLAAYPKIECIKSQFLLLPQVSLPDRSDDVFYCTDSPVSIRLTGLCFTYSSSYERRVATFQYPDLTLQSGSLYLLQGPSGTGKSTFLDCLTALQLPSSGSILYHDCSVWSSYQSLVSYRSLFYYSYQSSFIHGYTPEAFFNSCQPLDMALVQRLSVILQLRSTLLPFDKWLSTDLGFNGSNLSGGQRQRLLLTSALSSKSPVLILDEPTSALDPSLQQIVFQSIERYRKNRIVILVTHSSAINQHFPTAVYLRTTSNTSVSQPFQSHYSLTIL